MSSTDNRSTMQCERCNIKMAPESRSEVGDFYHVGYFGSMRAWCGPMKRV